jgi:hypothetical protein
MYGSTWRALETLYPLVDVGGWVIVDDYHGDTIRGCDVATNTYRQTHDITEPLQHIPGSDAVYWQRRKVQ